jgi:hypothetical protein
MPWVCPSLGTNATENARAIIADDEMFFDWMSSTQRQTCKAVTDDDVARLLKTFLPRGATNATKIAELTEELRIRKKALETKTTDANIAKDRASMIVRPELQSSYYDGWFPLNRPLKRAAVPIILFLGSFLISASFFMMLSLIGIHSYFFILLPDTAKSGGMTKPFLMLLAFTVLLFGITLYAFLR